MSKGQMEILGLTIIVILIGMAILFALTLSNNEDVSIEAQFEQKNLAVTYINTLLGTGTTCYGATFRELIQDCSQGGTIFCEGHSSCDYVKQEFTTIEQTLLEKRRTQYSLKITGPGLVDGISGGIDKCPGEQTTGLQYIPSKMGTVMIRMDLCE